MEKVSRALKNALSLGIRQRKISYFKLIVVFYVEEEIYPIIYVLSFKKNHKSTMKQKSFKKCINYLGFKKWILST